jgi:hypothetical protein
MNVRSLSILNWGGGMWRDAEEKERQGRGGRGARDGGREGNLGWCQQKRWEVKAKSDESKMGRW